jgi:hypothetical protein
MQLMAQQKSERRYRYEERNARLPIPFHRIQYDHASNECGEHREEKFFAKNRHG